MERLEHEKEIGKSVEGGENLFPSRALCLSFLLMLSSSAPACIFTMQVDPKPQDMPDTSVDMDMNSDMPDARVDMDMNSDMPDTSVDMDMNSDMSDTNADMDMNSDMPDTSADMRPIKLVCSSIMTETVDSIIDKINFVISDVPGNNTERNTVRVLIDRNGNLNVENHDHGGSSYFLAEDYTFFRSNRESSYLSAVTKRVNSNDTGISFDEAFEYKQTGSKTFTIQKYNGFDLTKTVQMLPESLNLVGVETYVDLRKEECTVDDQTICQDECDRLRRMQSQVTFSN